MLTAAWFCNNSIFYPLIEFCLFLSRSQPAENQKSDEQPAAIPAKTAKKIARILVFFTDGTYEEK